MYVDSPVLIDRIQVILTSPEIYTGDRSVLTKTFRESISQFLVKKNGRVSSFLYPVENAKMSGKPRVWFSPKYFGSSAEVISVQAYGSFSMIVTYNIIREIKRDLGITSGDRGIKDDNYLHLSDVAHTDLYSRKKNILDRVDVLKYVPSSVDLYSQFASEFLGLDVDPERVRETISQVEFCQDWYVGRNNSIPFISRFFDSINTPSVEYGLRLKGLRSYHYGKFSNPKTADLSAIYLDFNFCQMKFYPKTYDHIRQEVVFRKNQHIKKLGSIRLSSIDSLYRYACQYFDMVNPIHYPVYDIPDALSVIFSLFPDQDIGLLTRLLRGEVVYASDYPQIYKKRWRRLLVPVTKKGRKIGYMLRPFR